MQQCNEEPVEQEIEENNIDYQKMFMKVTESLAYKTEEADMIEAKLAKVTHEMNKRIEETEHLKVIIHTHERIIMELKTELNMKDEQLTDKDELLKLYRVMANVKEVFEMDRASKRARGD